MNSFISEHTTEYYLIPRLCNVFSDNNIRIIPFYFWTGRESNTFSKTIHKEYKVKLISFFPRRPKLKKTDAELIYGKINSTLIEYASMALEMGIVTIAGIPVASSIYELSSNNCKWFRINSLPQEDYNFSVNKISNLVSFEVRSDNQHPELLEEKYLTQLLNDCTEYKWDDAINCIKLLKNNGAQHYYHFYFGGANYKPVYLIQFI